MAKYYRNLVVPIIVLMIVLVFLSACKENENSLIQSSQYSNSQVPINVYLKELSKTKFFQGPSVSGSYQYYLAWYKEKAAKHRIGFRLLGIIVVVLSVILPVIVALEKKIPEQKFIILSISLIIALATGINSFYRFDASWKGYISAQMQLEFKRSVWEAEIAEARSISNVTEQLKQLEQLEHAQKATERFIAESNEIIQKETTGYFKDVKMPKGK